LTTFQVEVGSDCNGMTPRSILLTVKFVDRPLAQRALFHLFNLDNAILRAVEGSGDLLIFVISPFCVVCFTSCLSCFESNNKEVMVS